MEFKGEHGVTRAVNLAEQSDEIVLRAAQEALEIIEARKLVAPSLGTTAVSQGISEKADELTAGRVRNEALKSKELSQFLDPEITVPLDDQLELMGLFLAERGRTIPTLDADEKLSISAQLSARPGHRVIPTPLLDLNGRRELATAHQEALGIEQDGKAFLVNGQYRYRYDMQMGSPDRIHRDDGWSTFRLGYKTPSGEVLPYDEYTQTLLESGQAKRSEDGTIWIFPVIEVQNIDTRNNTQDGRELTENPDLHASNAETLMVIQLLHLANGTASEERFRDITNEGIYYVNSDGSLGLHERVTCLDWFPDRNGVSLVDFNASYDSKLFGVRSGTNGLSTTALTMS